MENIVPGTQFRDLLRSELTKRSAHNTGYSLRAFAGQLGISPSGLSKVMAGKAAVSLSFIAKIGAKLKLKETEIHQYQITLLSEKNNSKNRQFENIDLERFTLIKDWYYYAILNLMRVEGFQPKAAWISKRLGITLGEVQSAIERLQTVGLLKIENGKWIDTSSKFTSHTNNKQFNEAAKQNQIQLFEKARLAIEEVEFKKRNHTGVTLAVSLQDLDKAKEYITKFRREFTALFDRDSSADEVYHLSVALFPLTNNKK